MIYENKVIYSFNDNNPPIDSLEAGETLIIDVNDTFNNQLNKSKQVEIISFDKINPATGPFYVHQALPNTMLKVTILEINLDNRGVGAIVEGLGVLGGKVHNESVFHYDVSDRVAKIDGRKLSINPFLSIIGVSPKEKSYPCGIPHNHGGKIDCPHLKQGNSIYLPVYKKGGYLSLGGLKANQGFGQLAGTGIECSGEVKIKVDVTNKFFIDLPVVETEKNVIFIVSDSTLEVAIEKAANEVTKYFQEILSISFNEAYHYLSVIGSLEIFQLVNPNITVGISVPKELFVDLDIF